MRILAIEDDPGMAAFLEKGLQEAGYAVDRCGNGDHAYRLACSETYDLIVLDLMLPGKDGFSILRGLRAREQRTPVICVTARDSVDDRVKGLDLGADDYIVKPFSFSELLARIRALLRRGDTLSHNPIKIADLTVDVVARDVRRNGSRIELSPTEFSLLEYMSRHAGQILSRTMLLEHVWDMRHDPLTNVVDVHITRLRKKVDNGFDRPLIRTIRGVGYALQDGGP